MWRAPSILKAVPLTRLTSSSALVSACCTPWSVLWQRSSSAALFMSKREQSQSSRAPSGPHWEEGVVDPRFSSEGNMRRLNPDTMAHYVKANIQNDRREMGLGEVYDWNEFAKDAIYIPTRAGPLWVGSDDPRAAKFMRRREKMKQKPLQRTRPKPGTDPARALENHPLREFFTTATNLHDPLSVSNGLHRAGMIREYDIKHNAALINYAPRPPVVSIMGHVDHGKTTLLDYLRKTNVASQEAGGITQNVGAFQVKTPHGQRITFIDTPGHAAFTAMRAVGASANDMIILVVSAVDGVQPQTKEVIDLARELGTPMVVAITKTDRRSECDYIKDQLRECGVELEESGGDVQLVKICARDGTGIDDLLDAVQLQAELCEISTPTPSRTELTVIESRNQGVSEVAAIVRCGTLRPGQVFVSGMTYGIVRKVFDEHGEQLKEAGPSTPVVLHGYRVSPKPGSILLQVSSEQHAQKYYFFMKDVYSTEGERENYLQLLNQEQKGLIHGRKPDNNITRAHSTIEFVVTCKAATFGMLQALLKMVYDLPHLDGISVDYKVTEVGGLKDYDLAMVGSTGKPGCILLYGDCKDSNALDVPNNVSVIRFNVLYHGIEEFKATLVGVLPKLQRTRIRGVAECLQTFRASQAGKTGNAGGMKVVKGSLEAAHPTYRVLRRDTSVGKKLSAAKGGVAGVSNTGGSTGVEEEPRVVVYEGQLKELRRFKDLVPVVEEGLECGVILHDEFSFKPGDLLEMYETYEEERNVAEEFEAAEKREKTLRQTAALHARLEEEGIVSSVSTPTSSATAEAGADATAAAFAAAVSTAKRADTSSPSSTQSASVTH